MHRFLLNLRMFDTQVTTQQIAEETGFCDSSYFCKIFKRFESITPSQFRNAEQVL